VPVAFKDKKASSSARREASEARAQYIADVKGKFPLMQSKQWFKHQKPILDWLRALAIDPNTPRPTYIPVDTLDQVPVAFSSPTAKKFIGECKRYLSDGCPAGNDGFTWCDIHDTPYTIYDTLTILVFLGCAQGFHPAERSR